jgi:hypothetical protein
MNMSKDTRAQQTWDGLIQKRKRIDVLVEGQKFADINEAQNQAKAASLVKADRSLEAKERKAFKKGTETLVQDHARRHPDSEHVFASEGFESDTPPSETPAQSRTAHDKKRRSDPRAARHIRREDQEYTSQTGAESSEEEGVARNQRGTKSRSHKTAIAWGS